MRATWLGIVPIDRRVLAGATTMDLVLLQVASVEEMLLIANMR
jgi:hypothetical protein